MAFRVLATERLPARGHWQDGDPEDVYYEVSYGLKDSGY